MERKAKKLVAICVGVGMAAAMTACSAGGASGGSSDGDSVTIDWGFWDQGDAGNKTWQGLADAVHEKYPNITVKLTSPPFASYFTKLQSQLAANTTPCIVSMQSLRLPAFASAMEPLADYDAELEFTPSDWNAGALKALSYDDKQYAIPYGFSTMVMYYNKDMFAEAGVAEPQDGWTIDEFEAAAEKITEATGKPAFGQSFSDLHMFSLLLADNGAAPVTDRGKLDLTSSTMEDAFTWYSELSTKQKVASVPASSSDVPWGEQQFVAGNVAMAVDGTWNLSSNATDAPFKVGVVTLPQGDNGGGTFSANSGFGISKSCAHKKEAAQAISVITGAEGSATAAAKGNVPARSANMPLFLKSLTEQIDPKNPGYSDQVAATMAASSEQAVPFISTDSWDKTTKAIAREFILSYTGSQPPAQSLQSVQDSSK